MFSVFTLCALASTGKADGLSNMMSRLGYEDQILVPNRTHFLILLQPP